MVHRLQRWISEWQIERRLRAAPPAPSAAAMPPGERNTPAGRGGLYPPAAQLDASPPVTRGQIRLLGPDSAATRRRPVYIAILDVAEAEVLAAPHSPFSEPAVSGELLVSRRTLGMQVLCLWNARRLARATAEAAWWTDSLTAAELAAALAVLRHACEGAALPSEVAGQVGPPLVHPLDPRHDYLEEAAEEMDAIAGAGPRAVVMDGGERFAYATDAGQRPLTRAAEAPPAFGNTHLFVSPGRRFFVHASPGASAGTAALRILDADGLPTSSLDGARFGSPGGTLSLPVRKGHAIISWSDLTDRLEIVMADGNRLPISRI